MQLCNCIIPISIDKIDSYIMIAIYYMKQIVLITSITIMNSNDDIKKKLLNMISIVIIFCMIIIHKYVLPHAIISMVIVLRYCCEG